MQSGGLPPVAERLPDNPYVVPHKWVGTGKYGGTMQWTNSWGGDGISTVVLESMYGHSPLRWLNDGLSIGPGLAEKWESNDNATEWTFYFRKGLKWSDGEPWTVGDILYWWEDMVNYNGGEYAEESTPPDEARSGKGTLAKFEKVDDYTLRMVFDAPAPLTADRMAMWVNAGIGPRWMAPKHYLQQFHPKYNTSVKDFVDHTQKMNLRLNPDCPTMSGWKLTAYEEGVRSTWERNPFYWVVDKDGNQLPYIDGIVVTGYQDKEVEKLNIYNGKVDWCHHWVLGLTDVQALNGAKDKSKLETRFWDSGSGSGLSFFFNYDYVDEKMRNLVRDPKFRKALSHGVNRGEIQKRFYFDTGEPTTGTFSPKAIEYSVNDEGKQVYVSWRDSAVTYDPDKAKQLLREAGYPNGFDIKFDTSAGRYEKDVEVANAIAGMLAKVGVRAEVVINETAEYAAKYARSVPYANMFFWASGNIVPEAENAFNDLLVRPGQKVQSSGFHNAELEAVQEELKQTLDTEKRLKLAHSGMEILHREAAMLFLYQQVDIYGRRKRIAWKPRPDEWILADEISVVG